MRMLPCKLTSGTSRPACMASSIHACAHAQVYPLSHTLIYFEHNPQQQGSFRARSIRSLRVSGFGFSKCVCHAYLHHSGKRVTEERQVLHPTEPKGQRLEIQEKAAEEGHESKCHGTEHCRNLCAMGHGGEGEQDLRFKGFGLRMRQRFSLRASG